MSKNKYDSEQIFFSEIDLSKFRSGKDSATAFQWTDDNKTTGIRVSLIWSKKRKKSYVKIEVVKKKDNIPF